MSERVPLTDLGVEEAIDGLRAALAQRSAAVLVAPPGAGKSTLVPLRLLDEEWVDGRRIVMLEPRRLAARSVARRMSFLAGDEVGGLVGYQTRDERRIGPRTRIEVVTEGILTRRIQRDPALEGTALVIFDEVHERNVPTDLGLAFVVDARRSLGTDTRILAMSATAQTQPLQRVLAVLDGEPAALVVSEGRTHPVEVRHRPRRREERLENCVASAVGAALRDDEGDILVFLPGIGEINRAAALLAGSVPPGVSVHRLAGALPTAEQDAALEPGGTGTRKVILSTDIAETSLTVEGVSIVVDAGLARVPRLDARTGLTEIVTVTSSRASAEQRSGRAGRTGPGVAYRLWSMIEESTRLAHLPAEITQVDLAGPLLEIAAWGTPHGSLPLIDPLPARSVAAARETLRMLRLVTDDDRPTPLGRTVLGLPLHPRLGTMVARYRETVPHGWIACTVAALLEERDILRGRPESLPSDLGLRLGIVLSASHHDAADARAARRVHDSAVAIARRAGIEPDPHVGMPDIDTLTGLVLLAAYPDRLAQSRGGTGQFLMRSGGGVAVPNNDPLAREGFVVAADVERGRGNRDARLRRGAAVDPEGISRVLGDGVSVESLLVWDKSRDDLVMRVTRKAGSLRIDERDLVPVAGPETTEALLDRVAATSMGVLGGSAEADVLRRRVAFVRHHRGGDWPDFSRRAMFDSAGEWLVPWLGAATGRADLERIDLAMVMSGILGWDRSCELDALAPRRYSPPHGKPVDIDYADPAAPTVAVRVQHLFGVSVHPCALGGEVPLRVSLLSPADRPIQVTSDLPGFWGGSWAEVRREMAGRYPKHRWPENPNE